jgi:hypothetical protein
MGNSATTNTNIWFSHATTDDDYVEALERVTQEHVLRSPSTSVLHDLSDVRTLQIQRNTNSRICLSQEALQNEGMTEELLSALSNLDNRT